MAEAAKRRRRILEQGSNRLAFITGRIETLAPVSDSSSELQPHPHPNTVDHSDSISPPNSTIQTPPKHGPDTHVSNVPPSQPQPDIEPEPEDVQLQHFEEPKRTILPSDIKRAINSSQGKRLCSSILVALLVLLSCNPGSASQFFNTFRPLYLLLLTNLTLVIASLFSAKLKGSETTHSRGSSPLNEAQFSQLATTLELCLLAQNVFDALFLDCAVYAVLLVCGLSLLRT